MWRSWLLSDSWPQKGGYSFIHSVSFIPQSFYQSAFSVLCECWGCNEQCISLPLKNFDVSRFCFFPLVPSLDFWLILKKLTSGRTLDPAMCPMLHLPAAVGSDWDKRIRANKKTWLGLVLGNTEEKWTIHSLHDHKAHLTEGSVSGDRRSSRVHRSPSWRCLVYTYSSQWGCMFLE